MAQKGGPCDRGQVQNKPLRRFNFRALLQNEPLRLRFAQPPPLARGRLRGERIYMTFEEIAAQMKEAVDGIRKAIYGVQVREYIAKAMENVVEVGKQTINAAKAAKASEDAAKASEDAAKTSETNAKGSETAASASRDEAKRIKEDAENSAHEAANSQAEAKKSEEAAKKYAGDAAAIANTDKTLTVANAAADAAATGVRIKLLEMVHGTDAAGISFVTAFDTLDGVELEGVWNKKASRVDF